MKLNSKISSKTFLGWAMLGCITLFVVGALTLMNGIAFAGDDDDDDDDLPDVSRPCFRIVRAMLKSAVQEAKSDYWLAIAKAVNLPDREDRQEAREEAAEELEEGLEEAEDQFEARLELCADLEEVRYNPEIDPDDFVDYVDNQYYPLVPGTTHIFEGETEDGLERIEVTVTHDTIEIMGVECIVVRDIVYLEGEKIEDTFDYYAQDKWGNVWYFGEKSMEFEDGEPINFAGSWIAGEDGAHPGIIMKAVPEEDCVYRQEFLLGEAEDAGEVIATGEEVTIDLGTYVNCVVTKDFTPIEPDVCENKSYAPGIGTILEVNPEDDERIELIQIINP